MPSTAIKRVAAAGVFAISATAAAAVSYKPPRFLTVPVVGLRLPLEGVNVEPFPEDLRVKCPQLYDDELYTSHVWIFGQARNAASTYYVLTGYFKRLHMEPGQKLYEFWDNGAVYTVTGAKCGGDDAGETFDVHDPNADNDGNVPDPILKQLALDLAARTVKAFGGADQLRAEIKRQRIDFNLLSPELQEAFRPYVSSATAAAASSDQPPRFLTIPVLGLRLPLEQANLEPLPEGLRATCPDLENETVTSHVWVLGRAKHAATTYYVAGGYLKWLNKDPGERPYEVWGDGAIYTVNGAKCVGHDVGDTFDERRPEADGDANMPIPILKTLALDFAARTVKASGGADQLRAEIKNQRVDINQLPHELQAAFKPYFEPAK